MIQTKLMKTTTLTLLTFLVSSFSLHALERPVASTNLGRVNSMCESWAKKSKNDGLSTLIVSFEGLVSYSDSAAEKTYAYLDQVRAGKRSLKKPSLGSMNFVAKNVLLPHMGEIAKDSELLLLSEASQRKDKTVGESCVRAWHKVYGNSLRLVVLGHSFGGYASLRLAKSLEGSVTVDSMLTMDARAMPNEYRFFETPSNVSEHYNYFHKGPIMPGYAVEGATLNQKVPTDHVGVTTHKSVQARFLSLF